MARTPITWRNVGSSLDTDPLASFNRALNTFNQSLGNTAQEFQGIADRQAAERGRNLESLFRERITGLDALDANASVLRDQNALRELAGGRVAGFDGNKFLNTIRSEVENPILKQIGIAGAKASSEQATQADIDNYNRLLAANQSITGIGELTQKGVNYQNNFQNRIDDETILNYRNRVNELVVNGDMSLAQAEEAARAEIMSSTLDAKERARALDQYYKGEGEFETLNIEEKEALTASKQYVTTQFTQGVNRIDSKIRILQENAPVNPAKHKETLDSLYLQLVTPSDSENPSGIELLGDRMGSDNRDFAQLFLNTAQANPTVDPRIILAQMYAGSDAYASDNPWYDLADDNEEIPKDELDAAIKQMVQGVSAADMKYSAELFGLQAEKDELLTAQNEYNLKANTEYTRQLRRGKVKLDGFQAEQTEWLNERITKAETDAKVKAREALVEKYGENAAKLFDALPKQKETETETETETTTKETNNGRRSPKQGGATPEQIFNALVPGGFDAAQIAKDVGSSAYNIATEGTAGIPNLVLGLPDAAASGAQNLVNVLANARNVSLAQPRMDNNPNVIPNTGGGSEIPTINDLQAINERQQAISDQTAAFRDKMNPRPYSPAYKSNDPKESPDARIRAQGQLTQAEKDAVDPVVGALIEGTDLKADNLDEKILQYILENRDIMDALLNMPPEKREQVLNKQTQRGRAAITG